MQIIKPLLGLSAPPLGVIKFDTSNRFLLRKESNFQLGLKNCIHPLGAKSSLINYSKFLLPRRDKLVHDENIWNIDWDFDALTEFSTPVLENQLETNILLSQEQQAPESDINFIENFTTIITDSLPSTTVIDNSIEDNYYNLTSISDINQEAIPSNKSKKTSKKPKNNKSATKTNKNSKSSKSSNKIQKKSKTAANTTPEANRPQLNDNLTDHDVLKTSPPTHLLLGEGSKSTPPSLLGNSVGGLDFPDNVESQNNNFQLDSLVEQNQLEAKNILQDEHVATSPLVIIHDVDNKNDLDSDINIDLKQISNKQSIINPEVNVNFYDIQKFEEIQETKNVTEQKNQQKPIINQSAPKITPKPLESNSAFDNLNNSQDNISQNTSEVIKQPIKEHQQIKQQHTEQSDITSQPTSISKEISSVEPTEVINTVHTSESTENLIHNITRANNINSELPESINNLLPITETIINNTTNIIEHEAPVIQDNTQANTYTQSDLNIPSLTSPLINEKQQFADSQRQDEAITTNTTSYDINTQENNFEVSQTISPVRDSDLTIQKLSQDNLEEDYHALANFSENTHIENIVTNFINPSEVISTDLNKELVPGANLEVSDTNVIQNSIQHNSARKATDEIQLNLQLKKIPTPNINNTELIADIVDSNSHTTIKLTNLEDNDNLFVHEQISNEKALPEISTKLVDNVETETITDSTDSKNILPDDSSNNLFNNLQNKSQAPTGYATGGLVAPTNILDNPTIAPSDTVPAMLTPGEFVINVRDAQKNIDILRHINSGGTLPENITTPVKPSIEQTQESGAIEQLDSFQASTKVDILTSPTNVISPKLTNSKIRSSGINAPNPLQFNINIFDNSTENSNQSLTAEATNNYRQYSSPPLIFRQANTSNTTTNKQNISTEIPSQWESIEELLNGSANSTSDTEDFTLFSFGQVSNQFNNTKSHLDYPTYSSDSQAPKISTKRLPAVQGFAEGGEVAESDIATDIEPVTETIQIPAESNSSKQENNENDSPDIETLAREIYGRLRQRLEIERERHGIYSGRLPW